MSYTINQAKIVAVFVLVTPRLVFSQASGSQATETGVYVTGGRQPANPCAAKLRKLEQGRVDVLSDTQGVDFGHYLTRAIKTVRDSRHSLIPPSAYPPTMMPGRVAIEFAIQSDGTIKKGKVEVSSEDEIRLCRRELQSVVCVHPDVTLDQAAFAKDTSALRFDPLPMDYSGEQLYLRFHFYFNLATDTSQLYISPCNVRVPVSSTTWLSANVGNLPSGSPRVQGVDITGGNGTVTLPSFGGSDPSETDAATPCRSRLKANKRTDSETHTTYVDMNFGTVVMEYVDESGGTHSLNAPLSPPIALESDLPDGLPHGRMVVACTLDASGNVTNPRVLEAGPGQMTAKVLAALHRWKFKPAMRNNQAVEVTAILGFGIETNDCP